MATRWQSKSSLLDRSRDILDDCIGWTWRMDQPAPFLRRDWDSSDWASCRRMASSHSRFCADFKPCIFRLDSGDSRPIPCLFNGMRIGNPCTHFDSEALPVQGQRVDILTGSQRPWKKIAPADLAGVHGLSGVSMTRDGRVCLFSYLRTLSDLYLVQGVQ